MTDSETFRPIRSLDFDAKILQDIYTPTLPLTLVFLILGHGIGNFLKVEPCQSPTYLVSVQRGRFALPLCVEALLMWTSLRSYDRPLFRAMLTTVEKKKWREIMSIL